MVPIPIEHIDESLKLTADGEVELFELTPAFGTGTLYFKPDNPVTWLTKDYAGIPMAISGEKQTSDTGLSMPRLEIGQTDVDISMFKPLVYDGNLDNAIIVRKLVLLNNILNNINIAKIQTYRVKRVESYTRSKISLQLATLSDSLGFNMPVRTYTSPEFQAVLMS